MHRKSEEATNDQRDKIKNFQDFVREIKKCFLLFYFVNDGVDLTMFRMDKMGREVLVFQQGCLACWIS